MKAIKAGRKLIDRVEQLIEQTFTSREKLMAHYKVSDIKELNTAQASDAILWLERRLQGKTI